MGTRKRLPTLLSGSLLAAGLLSLSLSACSGGEQPTVAYGPGKAEIDAKAATQDPAKAQTYAAEQQGAKHGQQPHGQQPHGQQQQPPRPEPPKSNLPVEPGPNMKFDAPFDGAPIATETRDGGLKIEDFVAGEGAPAAAGSSVEVHYTGYLTDGSVFDSSVPRGRPFSFDLGAGRVIKGWDQGIVGMKVGGKRKLVVPAALGYGPRAAGKIPPNSTLVFTVELLSMIPPLPPPQPLTAYEGTPVKSAKRPDGLELVDFKLGEGAEVKDGDEVKVHYRGTLDDGTEFDFSHPRGKPITFVIGRGQVIKGWDQGIVGMKVGGLRKLVIPAELAYGDRARGKIPSNSRLTFLVEVMATKPMAPPAGAPGK